MKLLKSEKALSRKDVKNCATFLTTKATNNNVDIFFLRAFTVVVGQIRSAALLNIGLYKHARENLSDRNFFI